MSTFYNRRLHIMTIITTNKLPVMIIFISSTTVVQKIKQTNKINTELTELEISSK